MSDLLVWFCTRICIIYDRWCYCVGSRISCDVLEVTVGNSTNTHDDRLCIICDKVIKGIKRKCRSVASCSNRHILDRGVVTAICRCTAVGDSDIDIWGHIGCRLIYTDGIYTRSLPFYNRLSSYDGDQRGLCIRIDIIANGTTHTIITSGSLMGF